MTKRLFFLTLGAAGLAAIAGIALLLLGGQTAAAQGSLSPVANAALEELGPTGAPMSSTNFKLDWNIAAAGGSTITSSSFQLSSTIGQPIAGTSSSANFDQHIGFWQRIFVKFGIYLPAIMRDA
ncbi:MAG: hypothetical protein ACE5E7_13140 [Anaerolineae bacterium]